MIHLHQQLRTTRQGYVGERCPVCHDVRCFAVERVDSRLLVMHLLPLPWSYFKTTAVCCACRTQLRTGRADYPVLSAEPTTDVAGLLLKTNPALAAQLLSAADPIALDVSRPIPADKRILVAAAAIKQASRAAVPMDFFRTFVFYIILFMIWGITMMVVGTSPLNRRIGPALMGPALVLCALTTIVAGRCARNAVMRRQRRHLYTALREELAVLSLSADEFIAAAHTLRRRDREITRYTSYARLLGPARRGTHELRS